MLAEFSSLLEVNDHRSLLNEVISHARRLGFETVHASVVVDRAGAQPVFSWVHNPPAGYSHMSVDPEMARQDPVSQHCKHSNLPIVWNQSTYVAKGKGEKWEQQAAHGYCNGLAYALHLSGSRHFFIGLDRDQALPPDPGYLTRLVAEFQLLAVYTVDVAFRVLTPALTDGDAPSLTPRERECLRWTMEGKTAWELGKILSISEQTAVRHVNNAMHKLGCISKHQAVVKALRLGLID